LPVPMPYLGGRSRTGIISWAAISTPRVVARPASSLARDSASSRLAAMAESERPPALGFVW
jgi:hypothetical protein